MGAIATLGATKSDLINHRDPKIMAGLILYFYLKMRLKPCQNEKENFLPNGK